MGGFSFPILQAPRVLGLQEAFDRRRLLLAHSVEVGEVLGSEGEESAPV
jgi:hypothetical protein